MSKRVNCVGPTVSSTAAPLRCMLWSSELSKPANGGGCGISYACDYNTIYLYSPAYPNKRDHSQHHLHSSRTTETIFFEVLHHFLLAPQEMRWVARDESGLSLTSWGSSSSMIWGVCTDRGRNSFRCGRVARRSNMGDEGDVFPPHA